MLLDGGVLALLLGWGVTTLALLRAVAAVLPVLLGRFDPDDASPQQIERERGLDLTASIVALAAVAGLGLAAITLGVLAGLHKVISGAMCLEGALDATPYGWPLFWVDLAFTLLAVMWLSLDRVVRERPGFPLVRGLAWGTVALTALAVSAVVVGGLHFAGITPDVITTCCSASFGSVGGQGESLWWMAPWAPRWGVTLAALTTLLLAGPRSAVGAVVVVPLWAISALGGVVGDFTPLYYGTPAHHCPFDVLVEGRGWWGWPLWISWWAVVLATAYQGVRSWGLWRLGEGAGWSRSGRWLVLGLLGLFHLIALHPWFT
ncbi:MAG: hypothetical protein COX57_05055 [Alphaproteobacteria bacterium CG_4_10_14_0_2_um_filter_63_37]|nr:MAG: hypothetical protein AUJ55_05200 [Proteobacteria bacterium CG1_02_64_396]PJA25098.1 MAG: hypothetical protein COX57_05055 [Alphaproteobacteria bacterium CG_4_10_14_0_2_um_filter_63_37]